MKPVIFATMTALIAIASPAAAHGDKQQTAEAGLAEAALAKPPADTRKWRITSSAGPHGEISLWTAADGSRWSRQSLLLRGFKTEIDQRFTLAPDGGFETIEIRGNTPQGNAAESYSARSGYRTPVDSGPPAPAGTLYMPFGGTIDILAHAVETLRKAPGGTLPLGPSGRATITELTKSTISNGKGSKTLTAYAVGGFSLSPMPVWFDGDRFFGMASYLAFLPDGWESAAPALMKAQDEALAAQAPALLARIAPRATAPVAFRNVRLYDAEQRAFRDGMSLVADKGRIVAVGPAASVAIPAGATVFDGAGKTLVPGLWDSHMHYGDDATGPLLLAQGITNVRDPGNDVEAGSARRARIEAGTLLGPHSVPSMLIDGAGPLAAQGAVTVSDEASALAAVRRAKQLGFFGVKLYGTLDPRLVKPIATEAHRLGLRVHGHIQRTRRPAEAVADGYDEITHINWVIMQGMPQSVIDQSNGLQRFYGPYRYGPALDFKAEPMDSFLAELARRKITVDPTVATFEGDYMPRGELPPAYRPFAGTLPPQVDRGLRGGGLAPTPEVSAAQIEKGIGAYKRMVKELHDRGIPIVAGTDGYGIELVRDLELYVEAGLSPAELLATATIIPAAQFGMGTETGSLTIGKRADLFLVSGDPSKQIGDLRHVEVVMHDGRLMKAGDLRAAAGLSGPPR